MTTSTEPLALSAEEREVALAEAQAVFAIAQEGDYRDRLADLVASLEEGAVDPEDTEVLDRLLELALQSGRVRAKYGPGGEQAALRLYRKLPSGSAVSASAREVSEALAALAGKRLEAASIQAIGPGVFTLSLQADGIDVSVRLDRQGARLASVGV